MNITSLIDIESRWRGKYLYYPLHVRVIVNYIYLTQSVIEHLCKSVVTLFSFFFVTFGTSTLSILRR